MTTHPFHRLLHIALLTAAATLFAAAVFAQPSDPPTIPPAIPPTVPPATPPTAPSAAHPATSPTTTPAATQPATAPAARAVKDRELEFVNKRDRLCEIIAGLIEDNHGARNWREQVAIQANLKVEMDGATAIEAGVLMELHRPRIRMDLADGTHLYADGSKVWVSPASARIDARYHLTLWPYFISAPFRVRDRGTRLTDYRAAPLLGAMYDTFKIEFKPDTGENPNYRYMVYSEPQQHILMALGYWPRTADHAPIDPRVIIYGDYQNMGGVRLATKWTFYKWDDLHSAEGDPVGTGTLTSLRTAHPDDADFTPPADSREIGFSTPAPPTPAAPTITPAATQPAHR